MKYDYVIAGGGSAGCAAAGELAQNPAVRVLLLECGDAAERNPVTLRADGYKDAFINDKVIWERFSIPQEHCDNQRIFVGTGTGVGGSGAVNAMVYTRGAAADWDAFPAGWRWNDVAADFAAIERELRPNRREPTRFTTACLAAAEQADFRHSEDLNDGDLSGAIGHEWMNYEGDRRRNSYVAFIADRGPRDNLTVIPNARVHRIELGDGPDGLRAGAVLYEHDGKPERAEAGEVWLAAGALETPRLLMLSGLGPAEVLRGAGVAVVRDLPGIGANLHDHPNVPLFFLGRKRVDCFHPQLYGFHRANPDLDLPPGQSDTCYVFYPARSSIRQASRRILPGQVLSERLYGPVTRAIVRAGLHVLWGSHIADWVINRLYGIIVILGKPVSRGTVTITSDDPRAKTRIDPAYFSAPEDMQTMLAGIRRARAIAAAAPLVEWGNRAVSPSRRIVDDAALAGWVRKNTITTYHFAGTCRMGDDEASVVDTRLRVRGVAGLRVIDASVIPVTPVSALNAPSMLVGYRAAHLARDGG